MSKLKVLVIEDDLSFALELEMLLAQDYELLGIAKSAKEALTIIAEKEIDLIISDVFLEGDITGVDLAEQIRGMDIPTIMMTVSKDEELYNRCKAGNLLAYLIKPFDALTLRSTIELAIANKGLLPESIDAAGAQNNGQHNKNHFFIRTNKQLVKVKKSDIKWIQSDGNYCIVVTNNRKYAIKLSLVKILKKLSADAFIQVHKSYLVQLGCVSQIDSSANKLTITDEEIPIGRKYKPALFDKLKGVI